jgi:hypothetical protein
MVFACALIGSLLCGPPSALAAARHYRLAVLELETDDVHDAFAHSFTESVRSTVRERSDTTLVETKVSLTQLSMAQDCAIADSDCLAKIARGLEVDGFLFGKLTHEGGVPVAILRRYDLRREAVDGSGLANFSSRDSSAEELQQQSEKLTTELLGTAPKPNPAAAQLRVEPPPASAPASVTEEEAVAPEPQAETSPAGSGIGARKIAGWALLGGAVASAGMSVLSFVEIDRAAHNASYERYRMSVGQMNAGVRDVCEEASAGKRYGFSATGLHDVKSACTTGTTFEVLQFIFIGTAILTGGLATYLLATDGAEEATPTATAAVSRFSLRPHVAIAGRSASLTARLRF